MAPHPWPFATAQVGLLTSLPRHEWADARAQLAAVSEDNRAALHAIDSAIFSVSLTGGAPSSLHDVCRKMLHGGGADRWLDKSFQLIVAENGKAAVRPAQAPPGTQP